VDRYSGVAWCWSENFRPENINIVTGWESIQAGSHDSKKVPSTIRYLKDEVSRRGCDSSIDGKQGSTWGYTVRQDSDPFAWFKLLLLNETDLPPYTQEYGYLRKMRTRLDKEELEPVDVTGDYLRRLWNHVHSQIANEIGGDEALRLANIKVVMTIPAIWPSYAMDHMRAAADAAGIMNLRGVETSTTLTFISEPEAAACATLTDFKSTGRVSVSLYLKFHIVLLSF
jgi:molecular chaperone DnaK (HSP70)